MFHISLRLVNVLYQFKISMPKQLFKYCISLRLTNTNVIVLNKATQDHFLESQRSKNRLKKRYMEMVSFFFLET